MIFSNTTQRAIRNKGMAAVYGLAAEFDCEPGDVLDLLVTTSFTETRIPVSTPSQPNPPPSAVQTDGPGESSSLPTGPSVDPIPDPAAPAIDPVKPTDPPAKHAAQGALSSEPGEVQDRCVSTSPTPSPVAGDPADEAGTQTLVASTSSAAFPKAPTRRTPTLAQRIRDHLAEHPDATARDVAQATGKTIQSISWAAIRAGIQLRKLTAAEHAEASRIGAQGRAKPSDRIAPPDEDAIKPDETIQPQAQALVRVRQSAPTTSRFYLRDREGRFVHQSLQPCPTGPGPLMTSDRKWAWCDNFQRFKGARKLWPEIATMRRESSNA